MKTLSLTVSERKYLWRVLDAQRDSADKRDDGHREYFATHQATLRPKLAANGPLALDDEEGRYLMFTLGGAAVKAATEAEEKLGFGIANKVAKTIWLASSQ